MSPCSLFLYHSLARAPGNWELGRIPIPWSLQSEKSSTHQEGWQSSSWSTVGAQRGKVSRRGGTGGRVAYGKQTALLGIGSWQQEKCTIQIEAYWCWVLGRQVNAFEKIFIVFRGKDPAGRVHMFPYYWGGVWLWRTEVSFVVFGSFNKQTVVSTKWIYFWLPVVTESLRITGFNRSEPLVKWLSCD